MDFKRATALFADPGFDGDPVQIYEPGPDESAVPPENGPEEFEKEAPSEFKFESSDTEASEGQRRTKYYVDDVAVTVATERVQYLDAAGKLISESLRDYTRKTVQKEFANLTSFLNTWTNAKRKQAILEELALRGVFSRRPSLTLIVVRFFMKYGQ